MCVRERENVKTQGKLKTKVFSRRSDACALHMTGMRRVKTGWTQLFFASVSQVRPSREIPVNSWDTRETFYFAELSFLIHIICTYIIYTPINHICWGVILRENSTYKPWELEIVIPIILYTITCGFSSTPISPFPYHWEVNSPNTYHTLSECLVRF